MSAQSKFTIYNLQFTKKLKESLHFKFYILNSQTGFTLIELLVTIAIIAILSAVGVVVYSSAQKSGRISKRIQDLNAIKTAIELFKTSNGYYPSVSAIGTFICVENLSGTSSLTPTYMSVVPKDPMQSGTTNCYLYTSNDDTSAAPNPGATEYKIRTDVPSTEMSAADFQQQPGLIDPHRDATPGDNCNVQTSGVTAWSYYTTSNTACNW